MHTSLGRTRKTTSTELRTRSSGFYSAGSLFFVARVCTDVRAKYHGTKHQAPKAGIRRWQVAALPSGIGVSPVALKIAPAPLYRGRRYRKRFAPPMVPCLRLGRTFSDRCVRV